VSGDHVIEGERVALGPLRRDLADMYRRWIHDLDVRAGITTAAVLALEAEQAWIDEAIAKNAKPDPEAVNFTIYDTSDGAPVGSCSLMDIGWRVRRATFGIALGERRGQGLGTEATRLTLDWAFNMLGPHNVLLEVLPHNAAAIRAYEKAGFREIGRRRDAVLSMGARCDVVLMDAIAADFESPVLRRRGA
jgi:diamine N-acetyltransferase